MADGARHFDISYLNQVFQGNKELIIQIVKLFLKQVPEYVRMMEIHLNEGDYHAIHPLAHKSKSSSINRHTSHPPAAIVVRVEISPSSHDIAIVTPARRHRREISSSPSSHPPAAIVVRILHRHRRTHPPPSLSLHL